MAKGIRLLTPVQEKALAKDIARGVHKQKEREGFKVTRLMLDSGVFGAWTRKQTLDIKKYIAFLKANEKYIHCYATMDVIPGFWGKARSLAQVEQSAAQSYKNHQQLKDAGLKPIPIYHQGESFKWLEKYLSDGETYMGISTAKDMTATENREWLDVCFSMLCDAKGNPFVKTHGFGVTNVNMLLRYPFWTVDSTTWALAPGFGLIYVPGWRDGKPDYSQVPMRIIVSGRQQSAKSSARRQFENLGPVEQAHVLEYLQHLGLTIEGVRYQTADRRIAMLGYFEGFVKHHQLKPFKHLHGKSSFGASVAGKVWPHMSVMYASSVNKQRMFSRQLTEANIQTRLVSYFDLVDADPETLARYVTHGTDDPTYEPIVPPRRWDEAYINYRISKLIKRSSENVNETD